VYGDQAAGVTDQKIGDILDGLGVTLDLDGEDLVSAAVCILKVHPADGSSPVIRSIRDEGSDWITEYALIGNAWDACRGVAVGDGGDDE
jgi:hypothetical protein